MMHFSKAQWGFLVVISSLLGYFMSNAILLYLHDYSFKQILSNYDPFLIGNAVLSNTPYAIKATLISFSISSLLIFSIPFFPHRKKLYGSAKFAHSGDMNKMELFKDKGLIIGKSRNRLLRYTGQGFVSLSAPTGSGKGVSVVIPNLLDWEESVVVMDLKSENFDITSKYRKEVLKQDVYLFNPFDISTDKYNPLTYINMTDILHRDLQIADVANILYPLHGNENEKFFNSLAQNLFAALCYIYHDFNTHEDREELIEDFSINLEFSMKGLCDIAQNMSISYEDNEEEIKLNTFSEIIDYLNFIKILSTETNTKLNPYLSIESDNTRSGVWTTFIRPLLFFQNTLIHNATSSSDFDLRDLRKKKITIYIGITPDQLDKSQLILNLFWSQLISLNTKELPEKNPDLKYKCLLLMDEFTSIGHMGIYHQSVSYIRGYNLRSMLIYQNNAQLQEQIPRGYGKDGAKTILANHSCKIFFAQEEREDAEHLSKVLGDTTIRNITRSHSSGGKHGSSSSRNTSEVKRALMLPQEIRELPIQKEIITITGEVPILCEKAFFYKDKYFMDKLKKVSPALAKIKGIPSRENLVDAVRAKETSIQLKRHTS